MYYRSILIPLFITITTGCSAPDPNNDNWGTTYTVLIDPLFDLSNIQNIQTALSYWEIAVPVKFITWVASCDLSKMGEICIHSKADFPDGGGPDEVPGIGGRTYWYSTNADIYIYDLETPQTIGNIPLLAMLHELGHAQGLIHHIGAFIMNPTLPSGAENITADDANQWFALRGFSTIPEDASTSP